MLPDSEDVEKRIDEHLLQVETLVHQGNLRRALEVLDPDFDLLKDNPSTPPHLYYSLAINLADVHMSLENFEVAERLAKDCLAKFGDATPRWVVGHCENLLANLYVRTKRFGEAEIAVTEHISIVAAENGKLDPSLAVSYHLLVLIYSAMGRLEEAAQALSELEQINRNVIRDGHPDLAEIGDSLVSASSTLTRAKATAQRNAGGRSSSRPSSLDSNRLLEQECWWHFCRHDFALAVASAARILGATPNPRAIDVWLISRLSMGEHVRGAEEQALAADHALTEDQTLELVPVGSSDRAIVEFILGKLPFDTALRHMQGVDDECRLWFYAAMIALQKGDDALARGGFARAVEFKTDLPERSQASIELEALDSLACEISDLDIAVQREIQAAYRDFADYDWLGFLKKALARNSRSSPTPQLLLMQVAAFKAMAQHELADSFVAIARRSLLRWPWHARMLDLIIGRVSIQVLLPLAGNMIDMCRLRYYGFVANRLSGRWQEAAFHREEALRTGADCAEVALAELDKSNPGAKLKNINKQVLYLSDRGELDFSEQVARDGLALAMRNPGLDASLVRTLAGNLAGVLGTSGKLSESLPLFEEILSSPALDGDNQFQLSLNLGQVYLELQMLPMADKWLRHAWDLDQANVAESRDKAVLYNALGMLALQTLDFANAYHWLTSAADQLSDDATSDQFLRAVITDNIGIVLAQRHRYREALDHHERAAEFLLKSEIRHTSSIIKVLTNMAWVLWALGRCKEAEQRLAEALRWCEPPGSEPEPMMRSVLRQLAMFHGISGRMERALDVLIASSDIEDRQFGETMSLSSDELRMSYSFDAMFSLSILLTVARNIAAGPDRRLEKTLDIVLRRKALVAQVTAARRDVVYGGRYPSLRPLLEEMYALQNQIALMGLSPETGKRAATDERMTAKRDRLRLLETSLAKEIPELRIDKMLHAVTTQRVLRELPASWSVIEFVRAAIVDFAAEFSRDGYARPKYHYFAFVIPSVNIEQLRLVDVGPAEELDQLISEFLAFLGQDDAPHGSESRDAIRERLVRPLFSLLPPSGHVLIAPDGYLTQLPFEVLPSLHLPFSIDSYSFSYVTTMRDVLRSSVTGAASKAADVVIADPAFGESGDGSGIEDALEFEPLPGTRVEAKAIGDLLGVEPWLDADASKARLTRLVSPRILHIATHGYLVGSSNGGRASYQGQVRGLDRLPMRLNIDDSLLRSGLALAGANMAHTGLDANDGLLTASNVMAMNLLGTQLVVLSACDSARGAGHPSEGPIGIRRAFQLAGAKTVIASLWKLPDDQTASLMLGFYQRLRRGISCSQALRAAQLELRDSFPSPYYWGAFVCFGDIGPVSGTEMMWGEGEDSNRQAAQRTAETIERWSEILERNAFDSEALLRRGICYHNLHRYSEALSDFDRAVRLSPNLPELLFSRGFTYDAFGRPEKAIADFDRALELDPDYGSAFHRRGLSLLAMGRDEAALRDLTKAIALCPADPDIPYDRGGYFADRRMFKEACIDYSEAIRLRPTYQVAYANRGSVLSEMGKIAEAIADLRMAVKLDPADGIAHLNLGSALAMCGKIDEALECWKAAAQYGGANVVVAARQMIADVLSKGGDEVGQRDNKEIHTLPPEH